MRLPIVSIVGDSFFEAMTREVRSQLATENISVGGTYFTYANFRVTGKKDSLYFKKGRLSVGYYCSNVYTVGVFINISITQSISTTSKNILVIPTPSPSIRYGSKS